MKILIIEDEETLANIIKQGLINEGFAADISLTAENGRNRIDHFVYDLIILDRMLPGIDGLTFLKQLRQENINIPVLILTAKSQLEDIVEGLNTGSDDYMTKPFSFDELIARIHSLLRRSQNTMPVITIGDLTIDTTKKHVKRTDIPIELTKTEYEILLLLATKLDTYLSETDILNAVWDTEYEGFSNVVRVHIKNLRRKIDKAFENSVPLLHSSKGLGYKIKNEPGNTK